MNIYKSILTYVEEGPDGLHLRTLTDDEQRLIAAAPALLATCEALSAWFDESSEVPMRAYNPIVAQARAAIDKAKGE